MSSLLFKDLIIWETSNLLAVNKPSGVSVLKDRSGDGSLLEMARQHDSHLQACHRIDKETSGLILLSKNKETYRHMAIQFQERLVQKTYHALVEGGGDIPQCCDRPLRTLSNATARVDERRGKASVTRFYVMERFTNWQWVACFPETGRFHQIRAHLQALGHPIAGDRRYGGHPLRLSHLKKKYKPNRRGEERPLLNRVALHAYALQFTDSNKVVHTVEAPYPADLQIVLKNLRKFLG